MVKEKVVGVRIDRVEELIISKLEKSKKLPPPEIFRRALQDYATKQGLVYPSKLKGFLQEQEYLISPKDILGVINEFKDFCNCFTSYERASVRNAVRKSIEIYSSKVEPSEKDEIIYLASQFGMLPESISQNT